MYGRQPSSALSPFIRYLWIGESGGVVRSEHSLPSGDMHIVFRLAGPPVRIYDGSGAMELGYALVCGARSGYFVKDVSAPCCSIGAVLKPGGSLALLSTPAGELAERHTSLAELWGRNADSLRARIQEAHDPRQRLCIFENALLARLRPTVIHPAVAAALCSLDRIGDVVEASGYSHRHFNVLFRTTVGLTPKLYGRVRRFHQSLQSIAAGTSLANTALDAGYSDQAHFCREFHCFTGVTPTEYARSRPAHPLHLPRSNSFNTNGRL